MKVSGWIDFKYKLPYVNVNGGDAPYDYPIIIALHDNPDINDLEYAGIPCRKYNSYFYTLLNASEATHLYKNNDICRRLFIAWTSFDVY